jgi:serine/threonine-protein kinase
MSNHPSGTIVARRYQIVAPLGRGAQAIVYKAQDLVNQRPVALKVFPRPASEDDRRRFLRGPRPPLYHPNIVHVFEHGETADGMYTAAQFVDGSSLARVLRARRRLEPDYAIEIAIRVGVALAFAHRHGVIHRDVKPGNILVSSDGNVLLADFDLMTRSSVLTSTPVGFVAGTPGYMSPEQASGLPLDVRSDIFSLAAVLYETLAGRPWWATDDESLTSAEVMRRVVEQQPTSVRDVVPEVGEAVDTALRAALAKSPADRYVIVEEFVRALMPSPAVALARLVHGLSGESTLDADDPGSDADEDSTLDVPAYLPQSERRLREFAALWDQIVAAARNDRQQFVDLTDALLCGPLREAIGYRLGDRIDHFKGTVGRMVEAPFLWIRQSRFPLLFVDTSLTDDVFSTILQQLAVSRATEYFAVLIMVVPAGAAPAVEAEHLRRAVRDSVHKHDFVVLDREHLASTIAHNSSMPLIDTIVEQIDDLSVLSPYVVRGPVPEQMFFGREGEIKTISQSIRRGDHAVVGGRRIGKSSTLLRLQRLFDDDARYRAIYMDCEALFTYDDFLAAVGECLDAGSGSDPVAFRRMALSLRDASAPRTVVFLLDEMDELLAYDAARRPPGQLSRTFRAVSQEGLCRFVFSGSRTLFRHLRDPHSPFFNFCESLMLRRLDYGSVAEIVRRPMRQLGLLVADEGRLIQQIAAVTSAHPNLAQWVCDHLVRSSVSRRIDPDALDALVATPEFQDYYVGTAWGDATPLERLISITMSGPSFRLDDVVRQLSGYGILDVRSIREALDDLRLCCLLDAHGPDTFRFGLERFPVIVRNTHILSGAADSLAIEARQQCS